MKKLALAFAMSLIFAFSAIANDNGGVVHGGGKTCPPNQTCLINSETNAEPESEETVIKIVIEEIFGFFNSIFD